MAQQVSDPIATVFLHGGECCRGRVTQVPGVAARARRNVLASLAWLDAELADRRLIAGPHDTMADIVAQCAFVLGKAVDLRIPAEQAPSRGQAVGHGAAQAAIRRE